MCPPTGTSQRWVTLGKPYKNLEVCKIRGASQGYDRGQLPRQLVISLGLIGCGVYGSREYATWGERGEGPPLRRAGHHPSPTPYSANYVYVLVRDDEVVRSPTHKSSTPKLSFVLSTLSTLRIYYGDAEKR